MSYPRGSAPPTSGGVQPVAATCCGGSPWPRACPLSLGKQQRERVHGQADRLRRRRRRAVRRARAAPGLRARGRRDAAGRHRFRRPHPRSRAGSGAPRDGLSLRRIPAGPAARRRPGRLSRAAQLAALRLPQPPSDPRRGRPRRLHRWLRRERQVDGQRSRRAPLARHGHSDPGAGGRIPAGRLRRVLVLVPGAIDHNIVRQASRRQFGDLLRAGIEIYEYLPALLHSKTMVIDGIWATIGSTNLDNRSFAVNDELNVIVYNRGVAQRLESVFSDDIAHSRRVTLKEWKSRGLTARLLETLALPIRDLL